MGKRPKRERRRGALSITRQQIQEEIGAVIQEVSGVPAAEVTPEKSIVDDLDVDSLSMVEIGIALEDRLGVQIAEDRLREISTINDLVDHIEHSLNGR